MRGLICDDHPLMREALVGAVGARWPSVVLMEAGDFPTAWKLAEQAPDFSLVDLAMPGADPIEGLRRLRSLAPHAPLLVVTGLVEPTLLKAVQAIGVQGVLSKNLEPQLLIDAIADRVPGLETKEAARLSARQQEVLELLCAGLTNKEIGRRLEISPATVKVHVARLSQWLGAANRTEAVARAQRHGFV